LILDEATKCFEPYFKVGKSSYDKFIEICELIDKLGSNYNADSYDFSIDEHTKHICVSLKTFCLQPSGVGALLTELVSRTISYETHKLDDSMLIMRFTFPGVWEPV